MSTASSPPARLEITVAAAAAATGLTPATLRTWDRRYGLSPSIRTEGGHRRYTDADLLRLRSVARLVDDGVPPATAAEAVSGWTIEQCDSLLQPASGPAPAIGGVPDAVRERQPRSGRNPLQLANATWEQAAMARAAFALDGQGARDIVSAAIVRSGVVRAWEELAAPVLVAIGDRWSRVESGVEIEHILSLAIAQALDVDGVSNPVGRPVLLCCAPGEQHCLALLALRAALAERGVAAIMLGSQLPVQALAAASTRLRPRAIVIWASMGAHADHSVLACLPKLRPPARLFLAGPGWSRSAEGEAVATFLPSLSAAVWELGR